MRAESCGSSAQYMADAVSHSIKTDEDLPGDAHEISGATLLRHVPHPRARRDRVRDHRDRDPWNHSCTEAFSIYE